MIMAMDAKRLDDDSDNESVDSLFGTYGRRASPSELLGAAKGDPEASTEEEDKLVMLRTEAFEEEPARATPATSPIGAPREDTVVIPASEGSFTFTLGSQQELITKLFFGIEGKGDIRFISKSYEDIKDNNVTLPYTEAYVRHVIESQESSRAYDEDIAAMRKAITDQLYPYTALIGLVDKLGLEGDYSLKLRGTDEQMADAIADRFNSITSDLDEAQERSRQYWATCEKLHTAENALQTAEREKAQAVAQIKHLQEQAAAHTAELEAAKKRQEALASTEHATAMALDKLRGEYRNLQERHASEIQCIEQEHAANVAKVRGDLSASFQRTMQEAQEAARTQLAAATSRLEEAEASRKKAEEERTALKSWVASFRDNANALLG